MAKVITQHRRGTTAEWQRSTIVPAVGEFVIEQCSDNSTKIKVGDGVNTFQNLPYITEQLEAQLNNLASVKVNPDGTLTEGDHKTLLDLAREIQDLRLGYDNKVYESAGTAVRALGEQFHRFKNAEAIDGLHYEDNMLYLTANGGKILEKTGVQIIGGSGSGGSGGDSDSGHSVTLKNLVTNKDGHNTTKIDATTDDPVLLKFLFTSTLDGESTGSCVCTLDVGGSQKLTNYRINNGTETVLPITNYLRSGENVVKVICTDPYGISRTLIYTVDILTLKLSSTFNSFLPYDKDIDFRYNINTTVDSVHVEYYITPPGGEKTLLSEVTLTAEDIELGPRINIPVSRLTHGITKFDIHAEAALTENTIEDDLTFDLIVALPNETAAMIASPVVLKNVTEGDLISIPYVVYDPSHTECKVLLQTSVFTDGSYVVVSTDPVTVGRDVKNWNTRKYPSGNVRFSILYYESYNADGTGNNLKAEKHHDVTVSPSIVDVDPVPDPVLYLSSSDRSNDKDNKDVWEYNGITTTFTGFNWKSNGWVADTAQTKNTTLRINGGARAVINYFPFSNMDSALLSHGMTVELEYAIRDLTNRDATVIKCCNEVTRTVVETSKNETTGETIEVTKEKNFVIGLKALPDKIIFGSTHTNVTCNYKPEERFRVSFVVDQDADTSSRFISAYLDGTLTQVQNYTSDDEFSSNWNIQLGSDGCTLDVYSIRIYDTALKPSQILRNTIADETDTSRKLELFTDNNIYDKQGKLLYDEVKNRIPTITFTGLMPTKKGDKKIVKMDFVNPFDHSRDFSTVYGGPIDVEIDVQGTSSQYYVRKNWKLKWKKKDEDGNVIFDHDAYQHMLNEEPAKVFCIKVDYAEGTGTHNTQNANFAETLYTGKVPAQYDNDKVRTTIAGFPCAIFEKETETSTPVFSSKGNFNFDKDAENAFGFTDSYDVECWEFCNNVHNTTKFLADIDPINWEENFEPRCYYPKYRNQVDFDVIEALQKKKDAKTLTEEETEQLENLRQTAISRFKRMHDWVVSTKGDANKFRSEFTKYFNLEYSLVYYVYTLFALMTDQRAKNMFLTYWGKRVWKNNDTNTWWIDTVDSKIESTQDAPAPFLDVDGLEYFDVDGVKVAAGHWYPYLYDNDTCFGIDNSGNLVFDYYHEDIDTWDNGQKYVYNGQQSVLWQNFRTAFSSEIQQKYQELRSSRKLTYDAMCEQFIDKGSEQYSASIYNEDAEFKYMCMARPQGNGLNENGDYNEPDVANLYQVKGDGKHQLKYFLQNRFKYCDSKWQAADYINDIIYLRINGTTEGAEDDFVSDGGDDVQHVGYTSKIVLKPFSSMYCGVQYGAASSVQHERCFAGNTCEFQYVGGTPNDLETSIFGASELEDIGDISNLFCSRIEFRSQNKLKTLKLGSSADGYVNSVLKSLSLNNLPLLQKLDITNCQAIEGNLDCSACTNIQEIDALGANSLSGVKLSDGGYIKKLYLPASISSLRLKSQHDLVFDGTYDYAEGYGFGIGSEAGIDCRNITELIISDCPNVDETLIFEECIKNNRLSAVRVDNLNITVDSWKDIRKYYLPREEDVGQEGEAGKTYFVNESTGTYYKNIFNGTPLDTGIPASAGYGYGLRGFDESDNKVDEIYLSGVCTINEDMSGSNMAELVKYLPHLEFRTGTKADGSQYTITSRVSFMNNDGSAELCYVEVVSTSTEDVTCEDPLVSGKLKEEELKIDSTIKYDYTHNGWSRNPNSEMINGIPVRTRQMDAFEDIIGDRKLYPTYSANIRYYPVKFYIDPKADAVDEQSIKFFETDADYARYSGEALLEKPGVPEEDKELYPFSAWNPTPCVTEENLAKNNNECVKVYAVFKTIDEQWEEPTIVELEYSKSGTKLNITGRTDSWADDPNVFVRIPEIYSVDGDDCTVDSISGFHSFNELQLIDLPDTLTTLTHTTVLSGSVPIQRGAFEGSENLIAVDIPESVRKMGYHTFYNCPKLHSVTYRASNADASNYNSNIFGDSGSENLELVVAESVEHLPNYVFASESGHPAVIKKLVWSDSNNCTTLGTSCFYGTKILNSVVMSSSGEQSDSTVFTLPEGLRTIGQSAFAAPSTRLNNVNTKLKLPETTTTVASSAFENWVGLEEFNIPKDTTIYPGAFKGSSNIKTIDIQEGSKYSIVGKCLVDSKTKGALLATSECNSVPSGVLSIEDCCFYQSKSIEEIDLKGVQSVGNYAFSSSSVTSVRMTNDTVHTLGSQAFYGCTGLKDIQLSNNIKELKPYCISRTGIEYLKIPYSVKVIGTYALSNNRSLISVDFTEALALETIGELAFQNSAIENIVLPTNLEHIEGRAFEKCEDLETVVIPDKISELPVYIDSYSEQRHGIFKGCTSLKTVVLGRGLTADTIADVTFQGCTNAELELKTPLSEVDFGAIPAHKWGAQNVSIMYNYVSGGV